MTRDQRDEKGVMRGAADRVTVIRPKRSDLQQPQLTIPKRINPFVKLAGHGEANSGRSQIHSLITGMRR